jgi:RNA polymerase sigma-70 factor (ECF subfamily)
MTRMTPASSTDATALVHHLRAVAQGDRRALADLYRLTAAKLFGICLRMLHERSTAEDALQEVYTSVWRRANSFDPARAAAMTWLVTLTRNQCIDRLRQHREMQLDDIAAQRLIDPDPGPAAHSESSEQRDRLQRCMETLALQQRNAVRAAFFTGATYNELAERLGVPLATMKSWIRRSLIRLRACLEQNDPRP